MRAADRSGGGDSVYIESEDLHRLFVATKDFDRALYTELRKSLRDAAKPIVDDVKRGIGEIPSSGRYSTGVRAGLAAGTRASIRASSAKTAGVRIQTSPSRLPANKRPLAKAMNLRSFRHQVFGGAWVAQAGRPYFGTAVLAHRDEVARESLAAVERASDKLRRQV